MSKEKSRATDPPWNWLAELDQAMKKIDSPVANWTEADAFLLFRYPRLRPKAFDPWQQKLRDIVVGQVSMQRDQIASKAEASRAVAKLTENQLMQLAALMHDIIGEFQTSANLESERQLRKARAEIPRRQRGLGSRRLKAIKALQDLVEYAQNLHPAIATQYLNAARDCLQTLEAIYPTSLGESLPTYGQYLSRLSSPTTTASVGMVQLFWFFRHECKLSETESQVRAAVLRNTFWKEWAKPVQYRAKSTTDESKGCSAVKLAVKRFRPDGRSKLSG